eukprot:gene3960-4953_t
MRFMNAMHTNSTVFIYSPKEPMMSYDIPWHFRQSTNFYYFTGFNEPESILVMEKDGNGTVTTTMFVRGKDREIWDGPRCGPANVAAIFGVDKGYDIQKDIEVFKEIVAKQGRTLYTSFSPGHFEVLYGILPPKVYDVEQYFQSMRLVKSDAEIQMMLESGTIAGESFAEMMKYVKPSMNEYEVEAYFNWMVQKRGAKRMSYPPVVASGNSSNTLHYIANNRIMKDGDLLLVDAGCEYWGYTSDITRTFPVNGRFSDAQRQVYEAVLDVNKRCIELCRKGTSIQSIALASIHMIVDYLIKFNILKESDRDIRQSQAYFKYYPHDIGHYLGMDTHDCSKIPTNTKLEPGTIITIEPGIYIDKNDTDAPPQFRGIGIRVEDDIVITENDPIILTKSAPKEISDIESIMNSNK